MAGIPRLFSAEHLSPTLDVAGTASIFRLVADLDDNYQLGTDIGGNLGASTTEGNFITQTLRPVNYVAKYRGTLYAFIAQRIYRYNGTFWDVAYGPITNYQVDFTGGGNPRTNYAFHSGLYVLNKSGSAHGTILVAFYMVLNEGLHAIWSEDGVTWTVIDSNGTGSGYMKSMAVWNNKIWTGVTGNLLSFDGETTSFANHNVPSINTTIGSATDYCVFKNKLVAVAPRSGTTQSNWSLFEFDGTAWTEKVNFGFIASEAGTGLVFECNNQLITFLPRNSSGVSEVYTLDYLAGTYTPTNVTGTVYPGGAGGTHGGLTWPAHVNAQWFLHMDNWTNQKVYYLWFHNMSNGSVYFYRFDGPTDIVSPTNTNLGSVVSIFTSAPRYSWSNVRRGEGIWTWEEDGEGDKDEVRVTRVRNQNNGRLRIYFKVYAPTLVPKSARVLYNTNQHIPDTIASPLVATNGLNGSSINVSLDIIDGLVSSDTDEYWVEWDASGISGTNKISLTIAWGVA